MINVLVAGGAIAALVAMLGLLLHAAAGRAARVASDQPPALLAHCVSRLAPGPAALGQPGILVEARDAISRCRACPHIDACRQWALQSGNDACPHYCPNRDFLARIAAA